MTILSQALQFLAQLQGLLLLNPGANTKEDAREAKKVQKRERGKGRERDIEREMERKRERDRRERERERDERER